MAAEPLAQQRLRVLEFYSGIGGMHAALKLASPDSEVVCAFEISDVANRVYQHNYGLKPHQGNIEALTPKKLDSYKADVWLLAPPCQPYTRQGLKRHSQDARASSFITLLSNLSKLTHPPRLLLVENVVGFESSDTRDLMVATLTGYTTQEFILTPTQYGVPYSRPRYFCLAKRGPFVLSPPLSLEAPAEVVGGEGVGEEAREEGEGQEAGAGQSVSDAGIHSNRSGDAAPCAANGAAAAAAAAGDGQQGTVTCPSSSSSGRSCAPRTPVCYTPPYVLLARARGDEHAGPLPVRPVSHLLVQDPGPDTPSPRQQPATTSQTTTTTSQTGEPASETGGQHVPAKRACSAEGALPPSQAPKHEVDASPQGQQQQPQAPPDCTHTNVIAAPATCQDSAADPNAAAGGVDDAGCTQQGAHVAGSGSGAYPSAGVADPWAPFWVPGKVLQQSGDVLHVVTSRSVRCKCFTKSYTQFAKGTGSVLATHPDHQDPAACSREAVHAAVLHAQRTAAGPAVVSATPTGGCESASQGEGATRGSGVTVAAPTAAAGDSGQEPSGSGAGAKGAGGASGAGHRLRPLLDKGLLAEGWRGMGLRYFTPSEVAALHSFPPTFSFPADVPLRARYQMLGNSLSAAVVADLLRYALKDL